MAAVFRKGKIFTGFNRKILAFIVDNSLAFKGENKSFTRGGVRYTFQGKYTNARRIVD